MIKDVLAIVFAGAKTTTLTILEEQRTNAAIPFGGNYRIIDFSLSNLANSGVRRVGVITQYRPASLIEHINFGKPWDFIGRSREVRVLPPYTDAQNTSWYKGTADAIYRNIDFIESGKHDHVLFLSGDDIYKFNFNDLYEYHLSKNADVTIVGKFVNFENMSRFGIIEIDEHLKVKNFEEKPDKPKNNLIYQSIAIFKKKVLLDAMKNDAKVQASRHSFSGDILPTLIKEKNVYLYENKNPWYYIGTIKEYFETSMKMLNNFEINPENWGVRTNIDDRDKCYRKPAYIVDNAKINNSILAKGAEVDGEVYNSILFPGVKVKKGAKINDSIIMHDTIIDKNASIEKSVIDKDVVIGANTKVGFGDNIQNEKYPEFYNTGITIIGKKTKVPPDVIIGKNCLIYDHIGEHKFIENNIPSGTNLHS
ncbi:MAG: glucose-1-phosphate adenylyltransferase [Elusimicrobiota bacterium]|jgi:glucose-1-phosphate adenylyltransferase|nr:glucose-1-phosphate adenylyltransferase [Elusimicrobiota bacterium]